MLIKLIVCNHFCNIYMYQIIMLYTLNELNVIGQLYLNKTGGKKKDVIQWGVMIYKIPLMEFSRNENEMDGTQVRSLASLSGLRIQRCHVV